MSEKLRVAVVEDEPPARLGLRALLLKDRDVDLVAECGTVEQAAAELQRTPVDLLFLDVQLARRNGFELLAALGTHRPPAVVFVTASDHHAIKAFDVEAVDYLLKPFDDQRFAQALARAKARVRHRRAQELAQELAATLTPEVAPPAPPRTLLLKDGARSMFLREDEIDWIQAQDYYVEIHVAGVAHLHRETLRELEARLDPKRFVRIHRSAIVRVDCIRELQALPSGDAAVVLRDGTELRVSRSRRDAIRTVLGM